MAPGLFVDGDPGRLAQIVANLLTNAAKYTEPKGTIRVTAARQHGHVVLRVTDNGRGIPADILPRIFDLFVQERQEAERSQGGLGSGWRSSATSCRRTPAPSKRRATVPGVAPRSQ